MRLQGPQTSSKLRSETWQSDGVAVHSQGCDVFSSSRHRSIEPPVRDALPPPILANNENSLPQRTFFWSLHVSPLNPHQSPPLSLAFCYFGLMLNKKNACEGLCAINVTNKIEDVPWGLC